MGLLDRIANYFKEWDGIDETAPKMELSIHDLRYIADMNVERCGLIEQQKQVNHKIKILLLDKEKEVRTKAIEEFAEALKKELNEYDFWKYDIITDLGIMETNVSRDYIVDEIAKEMKGE